MPFAIHRGQRIHYSVEGSGPLLILQHGLFLDALSWKRAGFVAALRDKFRVAWRRLGQVMGGATSRPIPRFTAWRSDLATSSR